MSEQVDFADVVGTGSGGVSTVTYGPAQRPPRHLSLAMMVHLPQQRGGILDDRVISSLTKMTPAA